MKRAVILAILFSFVTLSTLPALEDGPEAYPPTVTGVRVMNVGEEYFEIDWQTDPPSKCIVEYGRTKEYGNTKELGGSFDSYHRTNITGLQRTTKYHFRILAETAQGETGQSGDFAVTTGPQDEVEGGTPGWVWGIVATAIIVLLVYLLLLRPARA
jgi:hypothetical protein